jgi:hypothetical protein
MQLYNQRNSKYKWHLIQLLSSKLGERLGSCFQRKVTFMCSEFVSSLNSETAINAFVFSWLNKPMFRAALLKLV